jgi:hypothetical protein
MLPKHYPPCKDYDKWAVCWVHEPYIRTMNWVSSLAATAINAYTLDVSALAKGLYLIQVRTGGNQPVAARFIRY